MIHTFLRILFFILVDLILLVNEIAYFFQVCLASSLCIRYNPVFDSL